jgi:hypothetical protein
MAIHCSWPTEAYNYIPNAMHARVLFIPLEISTKLNERKQVTFHVLIELSLPLRHPTIYHLPHELCTRLLILFANHGHTPLRREQCKGKNTPQPKLPTTSDFKSGKNAVVMDTSNKTAVKMMLQEDGKRYLYEKWYHRESKQIWLLKQQMRYCLRQC